MQKFISMLVAALTYPFRAANSLVARLTILDTGTRCTLAVIAGICWSFGGVVTKSIGHETNAAVGARAMICSSVFVLYLAYGLRRTKYATEASYNWAKAIGTATKNILFSKDPWHYVCGGAGACNLIVSTWAMIATKGGVSTFLNSGAIILLALFSPFLGERLTKQRLTIIALGVCGLAAMGGSSLINGETAGVWYGFTSMISFSIFLIASDIRSKRTRSTAMLESWALSGTSTFFFMLPALMRAGLPAPLDLAKILVLGICITGLPDILYTTALSGKGHGLSSLGGFILSRISPAFTPIWIAVILKEFPHWTGLLGGGALLTAAVLERRLQARQSLT